MTVNLVHGSLDGSISQQNLIKYGSPPIVEYESHAVCQEGWTFVGFREAPFIGDNGQGLAAVFQKHTGHVPSGYGHFDTWEAVFYWWHCAEEFIVE